MIENYNAWPTLAAIRERVPLVQNITNFVAMDIAANVLLAVGASPAMVHAAEEVTDFVAKADALTINIGTLSPAWIDSMSLAVGRAVELGKPWVLDPVGAGATPYRRLTAGRLRDLRPSVIRGNGSEIIALADAETSSGRGVDSTDSSDQALDAAKVLARRSGAVVAVTGERDHVTDGEQTITVTGGHPLMAKVSGLGCAATCLIGACCAVTGDRMLAAAHGLAIMATAGQQAAGKADGPGSLRLYLLDALYNLDEKRLRGEAQIQ